MEIDYIRIINHCAVSVCSTFVVCIIGHKMVNKKINIKNIKSILCFVIVSILFVINYCLFSNPIRIIISYFMISIYYKMTLDQEMKKSFLLGFLIIILLVISEIILSIAITIITLNNKSIDTNIFLNNVFINIMIGVISLITYKKSEKIIKNIISKYSRRMKIPIIMTYILIIIMLGILFMSFLNNNWKVNAVFYFDVTIILLLIIISGILVFQEYSKINLQEKYEIANKYMKTNADLIEKYSFVQHQYKNQLILIKGYASKNNKKLLTYINQLLKDYQYKKYEWVTKVNYINLDELRYLIFYKLVEAENLNLKLDIQVSREVKNIDLKNLNIKEINDFAAIIGEYLDNAIYAAKQSKAKELCFDCYLEDELLIFEISNTYIKKIDIEKISKRGYSTKGENRGLGIYEIDVIVKKNKKFSTSRTVENKYFITRTSLDLKNSR